VAVAGKAKAREPQPRTARGAGVSLPACVGSYAVKANWSNLQPGTTYHYPFLATNADGTTYGVDQAFTTAGPQAQTWR
jgi:hypothetical protein